MEREVVANAHSHKLVLEGNVVLVRVGLLLLLLLAKRTCWHPPVVLVEDGGALCLGGSGALRSLVALWKAKLQDLSCFGGVLRETSLDAILN